MNQKRANTRTELIGCGLEEYQSPEDFGDFIGVLDYKHWGKSVNLWIYLTLDNGLKIKLSCFRSRKDESIYSARDEKYNFSLIGNEGKKFRLLIKKTKKGTINFESCELLNN